MTISPAKITLSLNGDKLLAETERGTKVLIPCDVAGLKKLRHILRGGAPAPAGRQERQETLSSPSSPPLSFTLSQMMKEFKDKRKQEEFEELRKIFL